MPVNNMSNTDSDVIRRKADLHIHSFFSDGAYSPIEILEQAKQLNLCAISITDHDNINACLVARNYAIELGIEYIAGVELSTYYNNADLHLLGYFFDYENPELNQYMDFLQEERKQRAKKIIDRLFQNGIKIDFDCVLKKAYPGSVGRPHIADVMVEAGGVSDYQSAFNKYIGDHCPCYEPKYLITPREAIQLISNAGGLSFIAHPGLDIDQQKLIELIDSGVDGVETVHPRHSPQQTKHFRKLIDKFNLLESGGSDCHGIRKKESLMGKLTVPYYIVVKMKQIVAQKHHLLNRK